VGYKKKLLFFTVDGKKMLEIPADSISDWRTTTGIIVKNWDTIMFVMSGHGVGSSRIIFMDKKGNCFKKIDLDDVVHADENNGRYDFAGTIFDQNVFFLHASPSYQYVYSSFYGKKKVFYPNSAPMYIIQDSFFFNHNNYRLSLFPLKHKAHTLLKYNIQTGQYQYALLNMWRTICPDTNLYLWNMNFALENNILFIHSTTGNVLYLLDKNTFKIKKKMKITSPYTDIGIPPCSLEKIVKRYYETNIPLHGQLANIRYDNYNNLYYIFVRHAVNDPLLEDEASFSIQIYSKKFKKLTEQVFDGKKYSTNNYMICSHGLLLRNNLSQKDYNDSTKVQYDLYKIENKKP